MSELKPVAIAMLLVLFVVGACAYSCSRTVSREEFGGCPVKDAADKVWNGKECWS